MKSFKGNPLNINSSVLGRVTRRCHRHTLGRNTILVCESAAKHYFGHARIITSADMHGLPGNVPCIYGVRGEDITDLHDGDVILMEPTGDIQQLWSAGSAHNSIMVTNTCNCNCIMCPQPSCKDAEDQLQFNMRILRLAGNKNIAEIGITGGEPTLRPDSLCALLSLCKNRFSKSTVALLTNGRAYQDFELVKRIALIRHPALTHCVSLHSDIDTIHDNIVGAPGSFYNTVNGLHNLARLRQRVEIRIVVMRDNYQRLPELSEFIYRNFPYALHIAFMGLESTGLASQHIDKVWIDPLDYAIQLSQAVQHLHHRDMNTSIYNLPFCLLPQNLWQFARDSISDWKKAYLPLCHTCMMKERCSGVFGTSVRISRNISPLVYQKADKCH
jgi:His-Xaa-Ser system radical SAM maturase HxsC